MFVKFTSHNGTEIYFNTELITFIENTSTLRTSREAPIDLVLHFGSELKTISFHTQDELNDFLQKLI